MSTASNWIGVQTCSRGRFLYSTQTWWFQKHLKSTSGYLTDVGGQRGDCQQLSQRKGACWLLNKKEGLLYSTQTWWFQKHLKSTSGYLVKQFWPPDGCRRTEGQLSAKGCVLTTQQERSFIWINPSEWWWREEWLPAMVPGGIQSGLHSSISEEFLHSIILRPKKPLCNWSLANPLLSMNKAWMDECFF